MAERFKIGIAILLLLAVAYIFITPMFDLDPTALRAMRFATLIFASIAAAASILDLAKPLGHSLAFVALDGHLPLPDITDLTCTRLC